MGYSREFKREKYEVIREETDAIKEWLLSDDRRNLIIECSTVSWGRRVMRLLYEWRHLVSNQLAESSDTPISNPLLRFSLRLEALEGGDARILVRKGETTRISLEGE